MRVWARIAAICGSVTAHSAYGEDAQVCFAAPAPVIRISLPSRYQDDSKTRSDIDEKANAAVNAALKPVDSFVTDLARQSNRALREAKDENPDTATEAADCVLDRIADWARADALSGLDSVGARMAIPSRVGGIAFAYVQALPLASDDPDRRRIIDGWLRVRASQTIAFFDTDAPPRAAKNNLRAWAGLAVTQIGLTVGDDDFVSWGKNSAIMIACSAAEDGSLPLEMERGRLALHYHLHAIGPLVVTAALTEPAGAGLFTVCDNAIPRIVDFGIAALADPTLAMAHAGVVQSYADGKDKVEAFEVAWITPLLSFADAPAAAALGATFETLGNSKLGGDQALLWDENGPVPVGSASAAKE